MVRRAVMRCGLVTICYNEERFIKPFLEHIPKWVDEVTVLVSTKPWNGEHKKQDDTANIARGMGVNVVEKHWTSETDQRNTGQLLHQDKDWVIILDPDEFLDDENWGNLKKYLEASKADAAIVEGQRTYWKNGWMADPPRDYPMLIAARPSVKFVDKRVIGASYEVAPVWLDHLSWARTNDEVWSKISHYAHATDFNIEEWYKNVWLKWQPGDEDVHPVTPSTLHRFMKAELPPELERLDLWPK